MKTFQDIAKLDFKPPADEHMAVEAMSIFDLKKRASEDHFQKLQRADFYRLIGLEGGHSTPMVDFSRFPLKACDWILVRPGQVMRYDFSREWDGWLLVFRPDSLFSRGRNHQTDEARLLQRVEDLACLHSLDLEQSKWMGRSLIQMRSDGELEVDRSLRNEILRLQLASTLLRLSMWQGARKELSHPMKSNASDFKRFKRQVETDFTKHHLAQHYANALGMSEKSLSRLCLAATGVSAKAWITQRVCLEAKRLLAHTSLTVQTIGTELGYEDASNFVKFFHRESGLTPSAFRHENTRV